MFERLRNDELARALDEVIACLGIGEEVRFNKFSALLEKKDVEGCIREIATCLGLPIRIVLSYVPRAPRPGTTNGFRSSALARTGQDGRGREGIVAQVEIPSHLPTAGTPSLKDYPIRVRVSEGCSDLKSTFVALMAHELSHILLACLRSPHQQSELHTDLVPIVLGFREIVRKGRKRVQSDVTDEGVDVAEYTYGYLTDAQFDFACNYLAELLDRHTLEKKHLLELVEQTHRAMEESEQQLSKLHDYLQQLDTTRPDKMKREHAERIVQLHSEGYTCELERPINSARKRADAAESFLKMISRYTDDTVEQLRGHVQALELTSADISRLKEDLANDEKMLRRYTGLRYRFRRIVPFS